MGRMLSMSGSSVAHYSVHVVQVVITTLVISDNEQACILHDERIYNIYKRRYT